MPERPASFAAPKGVPEYFPPESAGFEHVRNTLQTAADRAGYGLIELPVFEETGLYARGVGESTDVVSKEMYTFADRGDRSVTLRPEGTAGVVRAVIEHGLDRAGLPVKLRYAGPFFRYERPQAGRYRQLQQVGIEAIGVDDPALDAEVIAVADEGFQRPRAARLPAGAHLARRRGLPPGLRGAAARLPRRRSTSTSPPGAARSSTRCGCSTTSVPRSAPLVADAPLLVDHLSPASAAHHAAVKQHLDDLGVAYVENPRMVRGLDYYTKTTFEFVHDGLGAQSGIGGGGRYDGLMAVLGGQPLSGVGYGIGVDRTLLACRVEGVAPWSEARCEVFGVPLGEAARRRLVVLAADLRRAGVRVDLAYGGRGLKGAMKAADRSGARFALVLGDRDLAAGQVGLKDLATGEQAPVLLDGVVDAVVAALG